LSEMTKAIERRPAAGSPRGTAGWIRTTDLLIHSQAL
jgi:hypothetical protein